MGSLRMGAHRFPLLSPVLTPEVWERLVPSAWVLIPSVPLPQATWEYVHEQPSQPHSCTWNQESPAVGLWTLKNTEGDEEIFRGSPKSWREAWVRRGAKRACHEQEQKTGQRTWGREGRSVAEVPSLSSQGPVGLHAFINPGASECLSVMSPPCRDPSCRLLGWPVSGGQSPCSSGGQCQMTFSLTLLISLPRNHA